MWGNARDETIIRNDSSLSQNGYFITWPSGQARFSAADVD